MPVSSQGRLHDVFTAHLRQLAAQAAAQAAAARAAGPRPWNRPDGAADPLDVPGTTAAFDRTAIDVNFEGVVADARAAGTVGDVIALKTQGDYVAVAERAYRARHCTPIRAQALAAARRHGHGHDAGVFQGGALRYVQGVLKAGQS